MVVFKDLLGRQIIQDNEPEPAPMADGKAVKGVRRRLALSGPRRVMCDLLAFAKAIPTVPVQRQINVARVAAARARIALASDTPGWCAIFTKAYAITALRFPELRRAYLSFPLPSLYEHPNSIASIAI